MSIEGQFLAARQQYVVLPCKDALLCLVGMAGHALRDTMSRWMPSAVDRAIESGFCEGAVR